MNVQTPNPESRIPNPADERLHAAIADAFAAPAVSEALTARLERLEADARANAKPTPRRFSLRMMRPALAAGFALTGITLGVAVFAPLVPVSAAARIMQAMKDARSAHSVNYDVLPDGSRIKASEFWYDNGKWRIEDKYSSTACADGICTTYYKKERRAESQKADAPAGYEGWKGFSMASLQAADVQTQTPYTKIREQIEGGKRISVYKMGGDLYPQIENYLFVTPDFLPIRVESYRKTEDGREPRLTNVGFMVYNRDFDPATFVLKLPTGIVVEDKDQRIARLKHEWMPRLKEGVAEKTVYNTHIVIRDFRVNEDGDAFILYTDGSKPGEGSDGNGMELTDANGTKYLRPVQSLDLGPVRTPINNWKAGGLHFDPRTNQPESEGMVIDGEEVQAAHFVPMTNVPQNIWPRTFTLRRTIGDKMEFVFPVAAPTPEYVPGYAPLMMMSSNEEDLRQGRMGLLASYAHYREKDLPKALRIYEALQAQTERHADWTINTDFYYARAGLLIEMNRPADALTLIQAAAATTLYNKAELEKINALKAKIEAALQQN